jgi:hypothetical protein
MLCFPLCLVNTSEAGSEKLISKRGPLWLARVTCHREGTTMREKAVRVELLNNN